MVPTLGFMLLLFGVWFLYQRQGICFRCSGRGGHRPDCPDSQT